MNRRESRELAFVLLFEKSFGEATLEELIEAAGEAWDVVAGSFSLELANGVCAEQEMLDERIQAHSLNWNLSRTSRVARTLLRLAVYEMLQRDDVPVSVAINEAVELAKKYGGDEDASFINGVLGGVARSLPAQE